MAITASQVTTNNSLEQFRQEFNNLQSDVRGLESGTVSFSTVGTNLQLIFEGATDDDNETTLGVIDPTADRTINLPNASGTVFLQEDTDNGDIITGKRQSPLVMSHQQMMRYYLVMQMQAFLKELQ